MSSRRIGYGLLFPFRRGASDFDSGTGAKLLRSRARKVAGTAAHGFGGKVSGDYPWRQNFGSWLRFLRHRNLNRAGEDLAKVYLSEAFNRWDSAVLVDTARTSFVPTGVQSTTKKIRLYFDVTGDRGSGVDSNPDVDRNYIEVSE
jgi:hypothetical protein